MNNVKRKTKILLIIREKKKIRKSCITVNKHLVILDLALSNKCATIIIYLQGGKNAVNPWPPVIYLTRHYFVRRVLNSPMKLQCGYKTQIHWKIKIDISNISMILDVHKQFSSRRAIVLGYTQLYFIIMFLYPFDFDGFFFAVYSNPYRRPDEIRTYTYTHTHARAWE